MQSLVVDHEVGRDAVVVRVQGDVDSNTVDTLRGHLTAAIEAAAGHPARLLVLDLQDVTYFGSAGLNAVLDCHDAGSSEGTAIRLVADHPFVLRPIEVTNLDRILRTFPTVADAVAHGDSDGSRPD